MVDRDVYSKGVCGDLASTTGVIDGVPCDERRVGESVSILLVVITCILMLNCGVYRDCLLHFPVVTPARSWFQGLIYYTIAYTFCPPVLPR